MYRRFLGVAALATTVLIAGCTGKPAAARPKPAAATAKAAPVVDYTQWDAGKSAPVADPMYPQHGNPGLDVLHYDLRLNWEPGTKTLTGLATLQIRPVTSAATITLDFMPYTLDKVTVDDAVAPAVVREQKLVVQRAVTADQPVTLVVAYHGTPQTVPEPSKRSDVEPMGLTINKAGGLWTMQEPYGAYTWYPSNDQPSDEALYDVAVTVPAGWSAISAGTPGGQQGNTFTYHSAEPIATYLETLAVGKFAKITAKGPGGLPLTYWYTPGKDEKYLVAVKQSPTYLAFLEQHFGPYPFPTGGIVLVDSDSGMETQQMITLGDKWPAWTKAMQEEFSEDVLHEWSHQWYGDSVTPTVWTDLWLNEGWAMFAQYLWEQKVYHLSNAQLWTFLRKEDAKFRKEYGAPSKSAANAFAMSNVYVCPAAMLWELKTKLGDAKFYAMARAWVQTQKDSKQTRASFIAFVNAYTHQNYTSLINNWLDAPSTPA